MSIGVSWLRISMKKRVASTPMSSSRSSSRAKSPRRFDIRARSPPSTRLTICMIETSNASAGRAEGDDRGAHPVDVAVVVGAEHVDQQVEAALELVAVVGDVGGEVGRRAVGADQDPVLVVAELRGPQPDGALAARRRGRGSRRSAIAFSIAPASWSARSEAQVSKLDARPLERLADPVEHQLDAEPRRAPRLEPGTVLGDDPLAELGHVVALVAALGDLGRRRSGRRSRRRRARSGCRRRSGSTRG